ncbi:hypothetical protein PLEOSDRAFT_169958 [Pleurotus ostreatus PC15]|uniref:Uncharacterized protein n=1 Tax=Pleurotus ostreatus (strain PC15) TaxID=1137138 RepID=A0A067NQ33_PLEO1|nr:hypothetical protein PLEOSDRAFT_169958 [Pleurotus ostreatus PC15]
MLHTLNTFALPTRFAFTVPYGGDQPIMLVPPWSSIGRDPTIVDAEKSDGRAEKMAKDTPNTPTSSGSSSTISTARRSSSIRHFERLIARSVQPAEALFPPSPPIRKGPSSRGTSSSKKPAGGLHPSTSRSKPPSSLGVGPQRTEKEARGRFAPYKSYARLSRKFKNVEQYTLWWPISSKKRLLAPPAEINNPEVNDLCINTIEDHKQRQFWIFNEERKWESINVGDIRKIGDERRKLVVNQKGCPDWVLKRHASRHPRRANILTKSDPDRQVMNHFHFLSGPRLSRIFNSGILQGQDERWYDKISQIEQRSAQIESKIDSLRQDHTALSKKFERSQALSPIPPPDVREEGLTFEEVARLNRDVVIADLRHQLGAGLVDDRVGLVDDKVGSIESRLDDSQEEMNQFMVEMEDTMANLRRDVEKLQHKHSEELPLQAPGAFEYDVTLVQSHREDIQGELNSRLLEMQTALADIRNDVEVLKHQDPKDSWHDVGCLEQIKALQDSQAATNQCLIDFRTTATKLLTARPRIEHLRYRETIKKAMSRRDAKIKALAGSIAELQSRLGDVNESTKPPSTPSPLGATSTAPDHEPLAMACMTNSHRVPLVELFLIAAVMGMFYALYIWKYHVTQFMGSIECGNPAVRKSMQDGRVRGSYRPSAGLL